jgi:gas vesicle protein
VRDDSGSKLLWFIAGASVGAAVAVLYAPVSGVETRKVLRKKSNEGRKMLEGSGREFFDRSRDLYEKGRHLADEAAELFDQGRRIVGG